MNLTNEDKYVPLTLKKERAIGFKIDIDTLELELLPYQVLLSLLRKVFTI